MTSFLKLNLSRMDVTTPWGFRMYGGKDFGSPFVVQKVTQGSLAERCDLRSGDEIVSIQNVHLEGLLHKDAQQIVINSANQLNICVKRDEIRCGNYGSLQPQNVSSPGTWQPPIFPSYQTPNSTPLGPVPPIPSTYSQPSSVSVSAPQTRTSNSFNLPAWQPPPRKSGLPYEKKQVYKRNDIRTFDRVSQNQRAPQCNVCHQMIRGPFIVAMNKEWCKAHFGCSRPHCPNSLEDGFVEEDGNVYCIADYEQYFAPRCAKCSKPIVGDCVNALEHTFHPHCFLCVQCRQPLGSKTFHVADRDVFCETCWARDHQTMCVSCEFSIDPGDKWVEAMGGNWHSDCFNCAVCQVNLADVQFFVRNNKPYCERHSTARRM